MNNKGGLAANGYIADNTDIDTLPDGIYQYNGNAYNNIVCSVGLPFINKNGIWIKKTPYNTATAISGNRTDTVIDNETGDIYTLYGYSGEWSVNKADITAEDIGARPNTWMPTAAEVGAVKNTGDTMKGALNVAANNSQTPFVITNTAAGTANIGTSAEGKYKYLAWLSTQNNTDDLYLSSNCTGEHHERKLIHTGNIYDHALNKAGGTLKGSVSISPTDKCTLGLVADKNGVTFLSYNNWSKRRFLSIPAESMKTDNPYYDKLQYVDMDTDGNGTVGRYDILHTGNKPSGSYTGNGEATERTINTGGLGNCCVVYGGTDHVAYLTPKGTFFHSGGVMAFTSDVSFTNGVIRIRNAYIINTANITYNYQVL
ncbi:MAG: hypothetical protein IKT32_02705 [Clostridia bacterium]|nr:hypothetical protein [Clostridia bacterium]